MIFTFLLKYWKYVLGLVVLSALGAVILVQHLELSASQASLVKAKTELATTSQALRTQNSAIANTAKREQAISTALAIAQHHAQRVRVVTRTLIEHVRTTPVGTTCGDAMNFLRREDTLFALPSTKP